MAAKKRKRKFLIFSHFIDIFRDFLTLMYTMAAAIMLCHV